MRTLNRTIAVLAVSLAMLASSSTGVLGRPRQPWPPLPEFAPVLFHESFDALYSYRITNAQWVIPDYGVLIESWSGYALQRSGKVPPFSVPAVDRSGRTNLALSGAVRFWVKPYWTSAPDGPGPGKDVCLAELLLRGGGDALPLWWLEASRDGSCLSLIHQTDHGPVQVFKAAICWTAGEWHQAALNFGPSATALYLDGSLAAEGTGLVVAALAATELVIGSTHTGERALEGELEEVCTFARPLTAGFHYESLRRRAALGPITPEEDRAVAEWRARLRAGREAAARDQGPPMLRLLGSTPECITNIPVYITNVVSAFDTNAGWTVTFDVQGSWDGFTNALYDVFMTPYLAGNSITNSQWVWLERGPSCSTYQYTNQPEQMAFYVLGTPLDSDGDGLTDAIESLVTRTAPNVPDPNPFPVIVSQPLSQTVDLGDSVTFTVQATGLLPLSYQWQFTDFSGTTNINGATGPSLTLHNVDSTAAGDYSVQVWNFLGSTLSSNAVLAVQASGENAVLLTGPRQDFRLKGDTTYLVDGSTGPVELYGTTVIEGGAVIKYGTNVGAKLVIRGPVVAQTGPYNPAIFTAQDDDLVGWVLNASTGVPTNYYASAALEIASAANSSLKHLRIAYAQTAVHYTASTNHIVTDTIRHTQILHCGTAFQCDGATNTPRVLNLGNILISDVGQAIGGSYFGGSALHLTVEACNTFATDESASALGFHVTNSVFSSVTNLGAGLALDGASNGFYPDTAPQFGTAPTVDDQPPFAPSGGVDNQGNPFLYIANGQGAFYLRSESPFSSAGSTNVDSALKIDFAKMTTFVPPELMFDDITSSQTIGPIAIRDPQAHNLGYHYPVVDYVVNGVTVNSATLNIEQGTVLACQGYPFPWGIRLNPGGRLNVNGVPTNRVVFAHLEAVQESPFWNLQPWGPTITWRELYFPNGIPTPYPEAKVLYADFPTLCGGWNGHLWPINNYLSLSYSIISSLTIDGCLFQGGGLLYDDGGPQGRSFTVRNTVFDRCYVGIYDTGGFAAYFDQPEYSSTIRAANNLFYQGPTIFFPVPGDGAGTNWIFTDNVFDNVLFYDSWGVWNGPVGVNHHNAYVGMASIPNGANRLTPAAPTTTDPDLLSLTYDLGLLGKFYLPATATNLLARGSRSAAAAGEYHFTPLANNQKEAAGQASIGPHFLALAAGGIPDSNGDGVPDFLADLNGDGLEGLDEVPWHSTNSSSLAILSPPSNSILSGIVQLRVNIGANGRASDAIYPLIDGHVPRGTAVVGRPATSTQEVEIDTTALEDGPHTLMVCGYSAAADGAPTAFSPAISVITSNRIRAPHWQRRTEQAVNVELRVPAAVTNYTVWFFNSAYPKANDPFSPSVQTGFLQGAPTNGLITCSEPPTSLGLGDGSVCPAIYSIAELQADGSPAAVNLSVALPNILQDYPWVDSPGWWGAAYGDDAADQRFKMIGGQPTWWRIADRYSYNVNPLTQAEMGLWLHDVRLNSGWRLCGPLSSGGTRPTLAFDPHPTNPKVAQTWPMRILFGSDLPEMHFFFDSRKLVDVLANPGVRNFYGYGHGHPEDFLNMSASRLCRNIHHRYRFVFLDGCSTAPGNLFCAFGATDEELALPVYPPSDVPPPPSIAPDYDYYRLKAQMRPAAFLGWKTDVPDAYSVPQGVTDARTGETCYMSVYEALNNWHSQLLFYWVFGDRLVQAIRNANDVAMGAFSDPPVRSDMTTRLPDGQVILFLPDPCLRVYGYGSLRFNEYNHAGEWPPQ